MTAIAHGSFEPKQFKFKVRESSLPRILTGTLIGTLLGSATGVTLSSIQAQDQTVQASKNALSHFRRSWIGLSFVFSGVFFFGIELLHNYFQSADIYTNAHLTSSLVAAILQP